MNRSRHAFTLLELLVASALAMMVMALAIGGYRHSQRLISRSEALLRLHRMAGDIAERWEIDATSLLQHVACNTSADLVSGIKSRVRFTGMRSIPATFDSRIYDFPHDTDIAWIRWEWRAADRRLVRFESPPPHWLTATPKEFFAYIEKSKLPLKPVMSMRPNPVRTYAEFETGLKSWHDPFAADPSTRRQTRIYDHLFLTGVDTDGTSRHCPGLDLEMSTNAAHKIPNTLLASGSDLSKTVWSALPVESTERTLADDVSDCSITVITRNGTIIADSGTGLDRDFDGALQDGLGANGDRPDRMRLTFTLTDRRSGLSQVFTFTAKAPR